MAQHYLKWQQSLAFKPKGDSMVGLALILLLLLIISSALGAPTLKDTKTFLIYAKTGNLKTYDAEGKMIKNKDVTDFRNGELLYIITGLDTATCSANTGTSNVKVTRDNKSITFIETIPVPNDHILKRQNHHIMVITDKWDEKEQGFKFVYTRSIVEKNMNVKYPSVGEVHQSVYRGIAQPAEHYGDSSLGKNQKNEILTPDDISSLHNSRFFVIYAKKGHVKTFNLTSGELVDEEEAKDFRDGTIQFVITGPNSATMLASGGAGDVKLIRDERSLTFIETALSGNQHFMIITDKWNEREQGFKFVYVRNTESIFPPKIIIRSIFTGIAKPKL